MPSLPCYIGGYRQLTRAFPPERVRIITNITKVANRSVRAAIHFIAPSGDLVATLDDYECVMDPGLKDAFRDNRDMARSGANPAHGT